MSERATKTFADIEFGDEIGPITRTFTLEDVSAMGQ
jgi:hypothetical protein